jgi:hypothetical protein
MGIADPGARLKLEIGGAQVSVRQLVIDSRDLATTQIVALVNVLPSL